MKVACYMFLGLTEIDDLGLGSSRNIRFIEKLTDLDERGVCDVSLKDLTKRGQQT